MQLFIRLYKKEMSAKSRLEANVGRFRRDLIGEKSWWIIFQLNLNAMNFKNRFEHFQQN